MDYSTMDSAGTTRSPAPQTAPEPKKSPWRKRITFSSLAIVLIAAAVVLPPLINVGRYQRQVTTLVARSLGRPVLLSSIDLRLLPRPGFILHDLSVAEDPAFGAEPVLSARTVVASIGILSLWRGNLSIERVSVDEASLNLVQTAEGRWNLESLMMGTQPNAPAGSQSGPAQPAGKSAKFPYLEATNSRVNFKRGIEKSPYSILDTDLSLWQDDPGQWRVRLRGQPVRTDIEMSRADTGEVRLEASLSTAAQLRDMPLKLQIEWREAHLGQLSRLILGSDAGWRGDLTADIELQGTPNSAKAKARLQATGVRREEFAPATPLDFDTNCTFDYQHAQNSLRDILCDTALGSGQLHLKAELPGSTGPPQAMLEVKQVPVQAALDLLRTVRSGFAPGINVKGTVNGSLTYQRQAAALYIAPPLRGHALKPLKTLRATATKLPPDKEPQQPIGNLQGSLSIVGATLQGGELKEPILLPTIDWVPAAPPFAGLATQFTIALAPAVPSATPPAPAPPAKTEAPTTPSPAPSGPAMQSSSAPASTGSAGNTPIASPLATAPVQAPAPTPAPAQQDSSASPTLPPAQAPTPAPPQAITIKLQIGPSGYSLALSGTAATARLRALAYALGLPRTDTLDNFTGGNPELDLSAHGTWIQDWLAMAEPTEPASADPDSLTSQADLRTDTIGGTVHLRHTQWKPPYLPWPADLQQLVLTLNNAGLPATNNYTLTSDFTYGSAKDNDAKANLRGTITIPPATSCKAPICEPEIHLHFGSLDAAAIQTALLGKPEQKSLLSPLMDKVRDRIRSSDKPAWPAVRVQVDADSLTLGPAILHKPAATVHCSRTGGLDLESWTASVLGGTASGTGSLQSTSGTPAYTFEGTFTNLTASSAGLLAGSHWSGGPLNGSGKINLTGSDWKQLEASATGELHFEWRTGTVTTAAPQPTRFESWSGILAIAGGKAQLTQNEMTTGKRTLAYSGEIPFSGVAKFALPPSGQQASQSAPPPAATAPKPAQKSHP